MSDTEVTFEQARAYPGARRPDRTRRVDSDGLGIATYEWGDPGDPPLFLMHGGMDFAGTYDVFAPKLADAGWRVVSWDHRGHGDSDHAALYGWEADLRDVVAVMNATTRAPAPVVGHSKGGSLLLALCGAMPERVTHFVNIDGMPTAGPHPDITDHERQARMAESVGFWLDNRRGLHQGERKPDTIAGLARRRARMNPRLSIEWLQYLVTVGARQDDDGWRWKLDPALRFGGFGPWRHQWSEDRMSRLVTPLLGIIGTEPERMGWGTHADDIRPILPRKARLEVLDGVGHFVHIERPDEVAALTLDFLGRPL